jgi:hypothetical protein
MQSGDFGVQCSIFLVRYYFRQKNTEQGTPNIEHRRSTVQRDVVRPDPVEWALITGLPL